MHVLYLNSDAILVLLVKIIEIELNRQFPSPGVNNGRPRMLWRRMSSSAFMSVSTDEYVSGRSIMLTFASLQSKASRLADLINCWMPWCDGCNHKELI